MTLVETNAPTIVGSAEDGKEDDHKKTDVNLLSTLSEISKSVTTENIDSFIRDPSLSKIDNQDNGYNKTNKASDIDSDRISNKEANCDLEFLTNALVMFVVEGRSYISYGRHHNHQIDNHANFLYNLLVARLTAEATAEAAARSHQCTQTTAIYSSPPLISPLQYNYPDNQCQIASRLRASIAKCIQDHLNAIEEQGIVNRFHCYCQGRFRSCNYCRSNRGYSQNRPSKVNLRPIFPSSQDTSPLSSTLRQLNTSATTLNQHLLEQSKKSDYSMCGNQMKTINQSKNALNYSHKCDQCSQSSISKQALENDNNDNETQFKIKYKSIDCSKIVNQSTSDNNSSKYLKSNFGLVKNKKINSISTVADVEQHIDNQEEENEFTSSVLDGPLISLSNDPVETCVIIDVYLLAECCFLQLQQQQRSNTHFLTSLIDSSCPLVNFSASLFHPNPTSDTSPVYSSSSLPFSTDTNSKTFELLERWTISMITSNKIDENISTTTPSNSLLKVNELFQAIRSYLHFSQISAWSSKTGDQQPVKNIAYSIRSCGSTELIVKTDKTEKTKRYGASDKDDISPMSSKNKEAKTIQNNKNEMLRRMLSSTEFDFHTFPILSLIFSNNKFDLFSASMTNRRKNNQTITNLRVDLESRKRSSLANLHISGSIPSLSCSKHKQKNVSQNQTAFISRKNTPTLPVAILDSHQNIHHNNHIQNNNQSAISFNLESDTNQLTLSPLLKWPENLQKCDAKQDMVPKQDMVSPIESIESKNIFKTKFKENQQQPPCETPTFVSLPLSCMLTPNNSPEQQKLPSKSLLLTTPTHFPGLVLANIYESSNFSSQYICSPNECYQKTTNFSPSSSLSLFSQVSTSNQIAFDMCQSPKVLLSNHELLLSTAVDHMKHLCINDQNNNDHSETDQNKTVTNNLPDIIIHTSGDREVLSSDISCESKRFTTEDGKTRLFDLSEGNLGCNNTYKAIEKRINEKNNSNSSTLSQELDNNTSFQLKINNSDRIVSHNQDLLSSSWSKEIDQKSQNRISKDILSQKLINQDEQYQPAGLIDRIDFSETRLCSSHVNLNDINKERKPVNPNVINKSNRCYFQLSSSPAPLRKSGSSFDFDNSLKDPKSIKNALKLNTSIKKPNSSECLKLIGPHLNPDDKSSEMSDSIAVDQLSTENECRIARKVNREEKIQKHQTKNLTERDLRLLASVQLSYSNTNLTSNSYNQMTPHCLLGSFEESLLNGRMNPVGIVDGFYAEIGASGAFFPEHVTLPVYAAFYQVCEDVAASPYLGVIDLASLGRRGYRVPTKGTIQVTLFNPNKTVVKMFVVIYDLSDMPASHRTFLRQRTMYVPLKSSSSSISSSLDSFAPKSNTKDDIKFNELKSYLRYLIHLRFSSSKSGKLYLHTNVKLIFARNKCEIDPRLARYEYKTFTEGPQNPKYSPKR